MDIPVTTAAQREVRRLDLDAADREHEAAEKQRDEAESRQNNGFVQVYNKGWNRIAALIAINPKAAQLYVFLAQHIDESCGAVCVSQEVLAQELDVCVRTILRLTNVLETAKALVKIKIGTGVYAYALNPEEVWKSYEKGKSLAAFKTKTLVRTSDQITAQVRRKLSVMLHEIPGHRPASAVTEIASEVFF